MNLSTLLPANRVAAGATWLTALAGLILAVEGTFPAAWQNTALAIAALLTKLVTTLHFMSGSQKYDALVLKAPIVVAGPKPDAVDANADGQAAASTAAV